MYSTIQFKYHCWVNQIINPSTSDNSVMPNKEAITILWSRDGNLDNRTATCIQQTTLYPQSGQSHQLVTSRIALLSEKVSLLNKNTKGHSLCYSNPRHPLFQLKKTQDLKVLELALLQLQNSCKSVDDAYNVLQLIWKTYHYSLKSEFIVVLLSPFSLLKDSRSKIRWLHFVTTQHFAHIF